MTKASAPAKIILFGEHAVVYGRPALAVPVFELTAQAEVVEGSGPGVHLLAPAGGVDQWLAQAGPRDPLALATRLTLAALEADSPPPLEIRISSEIPIAAGLGSGAAVSIALIRALSRHLGRELPPDRQAALAFEVEKIHHGTPSGIDNTVIAYGRPVYYVKDRALERLSPGGSFTLLIGDSGIASPTGPAVEGVRRRWQTDRRRYEAIFGDIGRVVDQARAALERGEAQPLGALMDQNHRFLQQIGVSHERLEELIGAARKAGALGAKLSGAGLGGNMIALAGPSGSDDLAQALADAGATNVIRTEVGP